MQHLQSKETKNCKFHEPPPPRRGNFWVKSVKLMYFLKNLLLYSGAWFRQTKYIAMITKEGFNKIVNFMTPGAGVLALGCGHISQKVKLHYFFKNLLICCQAQIRQTKYLAIMTNEGSTIIVNSMTPGLGFLCQGVAI